MRAAPVKHLPRLDLSASAGRQVLAAARDANPVSGLTHNFYRYPARFSPSLVRAAIEAFTDPGDLVVDPFAGGGTTLVEALAKGRNGIGTDISTLATFVSTVKTTIYSDADFSALQDWSIKAIKAIHIHVDAPRFESYEAAGYLRHLNGSRIWPLRKAISQALASAEILATKDQENFARCAVLRTAQWAMDGRRRFPSVAEFRIRLLKHTNEMIQGAAEFARAVRPHQGVIAKCMNRPAVGLENEPIFQAGRRPRLVITSPPYPGIHVLYHRWQIKGGRETPAPFWIANQLDGAGASYYTMGDRNNHAAGEYFRHLRDSLESIAALCDSDTTVVQVVAFSDRNAMLPTYLQVAAEVGLEEHLLSPSEKRVPGRVWRRVPNRKWYASQRGHTSGSSEVVLFHRLRY